MTSPHWPPAFGPDRRDRRIAELERQLAEARQTGRQMSQAVVIDYTAPGGLATAHMIEPLSIAWMVSDWSPDPQWVLLAWVYPAGELMPFAMASIHNWTPVVDEEEEERDNEHADTVEDRGESGLAHRAP